MTRFHPLPHPRTQTGDTRRVGVEVEFAGLSIDRSAEVITDCAGGTPIPAPDGSLQVEGTRIGHILIELDTALTKVATGDTGDALLKVAAQVVPVEIVTKPLTPDLLPRLDAICAALRAAGARGSRDGLLYGFGVHLNVEITGQDDPFFLRTVQAFACLEDLLRADMALDRTRRVLPFVNAWPPALVDGLVRDPPADPDALGALYARCTQSRNHGLDLLPILKWVDPSGFKTRFAGIKSAARPAFHFRLPESRIDEAGWSLADAWSQWHLVETVAADPSLLQELCKMRQGSDPTASLRDHLKFNRGVDHV